VRRESLHRFTTSTSLNDIVDIESGHHIGDDVGDQVRNVLISNGLYRSPSQVGLMVGELADNFAQHSHRNLGALALQYYPRLGALRIAVADCGIGIRASLSENPKHSLDQE
jgi:anti-sigma regulatory factor (Ser/Thr protein kinase)